MSAETLRRAAALMRERATAATPGPWHVCESPEWHEDSDQAICGPSHEPTALMAEEWYEDEDGEPTAAIDAHHIASWHPAVALTVAVWLESHADIHTLRACDERLVAPCPALAVARAYLREQS